MFKKKIKKQIKRIAKSNYRVKSHITKGIFCLLLRQSQKQDKKLDVQVFLVRLLESLFFGDLYSFCLVFEASTLIISLAIGLTISKMESIDKEIAISFFKQS